MPKRPPLLLLAALVTLACTDAPTRSDAKAEHKSEVKTVTIPPAKPSSAPAAASDRYASFAMPAPGPWSADDYMAAHKAVTAIAKQDPALLPRDGDPTFAAIADIDHLRALAGGLGPERHAGLALALGMIHMVYGDQRRKQPSFEREWLILTAAVLAVTSKLPTAVVASEAEAAAVKADAGRLQGLLRYRRGIRELVDELLGFTPKSELSYGFACAQLARVIADASPLLLAEERAAARERLPACEDAGADAQALAQLDRALADDAPTAVLVSALLTEHREFAGQQ